MIPKCIQSDAYLKNESGVSFNEVTVNVSGSVCFQFDWYVPPAIVSKCPISENKETLEGGEESPSL